MTASAYSIFEATKKGGKKHLLPLIDPDKISEGSAIQLGKTAQELGISAILIGGSILTEDNMDQCIQHLKKHFTGKILLFPGNTMQLSKYADGILFLSLISGRNPELLIGKHVIAAPYIKNAGLEVIPTGYMLIESGRQTSVSYMSHTFPIPHHKSDIALCTALAGEMLGLKCIYMDAGSGAEKPISAEMIRQVSSNISVPLIIGGGIRTVGDAKAAIQAGADMIVIGNLLEKSPEMLQKIAKAIQE
jgi:phosphoglycerol geranylgeranyltransferase